MATQLDISGPNNEINISTTENKVVIVDSSLLSNIEVTQPITNVVEVVTGPLGLKGDPGDQGDSIFSLLGPDIYSTTSSLEITGSLYGTSSYAVTASYVVNDPRPYKVYTALLTQTGIDAPVATVLENTIGDIIWSRFTSGQFRATFSQSFSTDKVFAFCPLIANNEGFLLRIPILIIDENTLQIDSMYDYIGDQQATDSFLSNNPIEIRVYN